MHLYTDDIPHLERTRLLVPLIPFYLVCSVKSYLHPEFIAGLSVRSGTDQNHPCSTFDLAVSISK